MSTNNQPASDDELSPFHDERHPERNNASVLYQPSPALESYVPRESVPLSTKAVLQSGPVTLGNKEQITFEELTRLDPEVAGLYRVGHELVGRIEEPGVPYLLAHAGRELGRGIIRLLSDESSHSFDVEGNVLKNEKNRLTISTILGLPLYHTSVNTWFDLNQTFSGSCHYREPKPSGKKVCSAFLEFSALLYGRVAPYFATHGDIDQLLAVQSVTDAEVARARMLLMRHQQRRYFFSHLDHPGWLEPLTTHGYFRSPPETMVDEKKGNLIQPWHEGEYLVRVAPHLPEQVTTILLNLPLALTNPVVWSVIVRTAIAIPAPQSVRLVPRIQKALQHNPSLLDPLPVIDLIRMLAEYGEKKAFQLAEGLLWLRKSSEQNGGEDVSTINLSERKKCDTTCVLARMTPHDLKKFCSTALPALEVLDPFTTINLLAKHLDGAVWRMQQVANNEGKPVQSSRAWCGSLLQTPSNKDVRALFAVALTGVATRLATKSADNSRVVWEALARYSSDIFERIRLVILTHVGTFLPNELDCIVGSEILLDPHFGAREAAALLRAQFINASSEAKHLFAFALTRGPSKEDTSNSETPATSEEIAEYVSIWQQKRLRWFHDQIPDELQDLAEQLHVTPQVPTPEQQGLDEVGFYSGGVSLISRQSPKTPEEILELETPEIISFLSTWHPEPNAFENYSYRGLEDTLISVALTHPDRAIALAREGLETLIPTRYLRALFEGLGAAVEQNTHLDWSTLISLMLSVLRTSEECLANLLIHNEQSDEQNGFHSEWYHVVRAMVSLVRKGCSNTTIPTELKSSIWEFTEALIHSPTTWANPWESGEFATFADILAATYNTVTGDAICMLLEVALWEYRQNRDRLTSTTAEPYLLSVESLLVPLIDHVLSQQGRTAQCAHAVLGRFIPQLHAIAPKWLLESEATLFQGGAENPVHHPAWCAYVVQSRFYESTFHRLRNWYARAATIACDTIDDEHAGTSGLSITKGLVDHVMTAIILGCASVGDEDALVENTFANVPLKHRVSAYWSVFRSWSNDQEAVPTSMIERIVTFWEWRLSKLEISPTTPETVEEADGLMWFLRTPFIPPLEAIRLGYRTIVLRKGSNHTSGDAWDRVNELAEVDAVGTFEIVEHLVEQELRDSFTYLPYENVSPSLRAALHCTDPAIRTRAERLIHRIGESGRIEFGKLLSLNNP